MDRALIKRLATEACLWPESVTANDSREQGKADVVLQLLWFNLETFARSVRREALEAAAKVCEARARKLAEMGEPDDFDLTWAEEIRALIEPASPPER